YGGESSSFLARCERDCCRDWFVQTPKSRSESAGPKGGVEPAAAVRVWSPTFIVSYPQYWMYWMQVFARMISIPSMRAWYLPSGTDSDNCSSGAAEVRIEARKVDGGTFWLRLGALRKMN